jgi:hypothetical protein
MDVLNRKLFANKEARNKLAEMGGIMASSEALMREAQNVPMYAPGGVVDASQRQRQFVITIPGYRNGAMFRINESTLMMMNDTIPDLMSQEGTQVFPVEMFGDSDAALKIRPGDAIINADLNPRQEQENPNPNLVNISDVPGDAGTIAGRYMAGMDQQMRDSLAQYPVPAVNRFDMELGTGYQGNTPAQLAAQQGEESRQRVEGYDRQFINDNANFPARNEPVVLGAGEANVPSIDRYDPTMAGLVSDLSGSGDFREPSRMTAMEQLIAEQSATPITLPHLLFLQLRKNFQCQIPCRTQDKLTKVLPLSLLKTLRTICVKDTKKPQTRLRVLVSQGTRLLHQNLLLRVHKTAALHCLPKKGFRRIILSPHQILVLDHPPPTQD